MKIFNLANNKVVFDTELLLIPEFKALWDADKNKTKDLAFKQFAYIYFIIDSGSPYSNFPEHKRKELVGKDIFKGEVKETPALKAAMDKYVQMSESPTQRLLTSVKSKIDDVASFLKNTEITEDSLAPVLKAIESTSKLVSQLATLEDAVNKEKATDATRRAGEKRTRKYED
jgi:hypothetical protein